MKRRLLVNDCLNTLGEVTLWNLLQEWFTMEFIGSPFPKLADNAAIMARGHYVSHDATGAVIGEGNNPPSLIIRNATWFPPIDTQAPTISLLQDIIPDGPMREMQEAVLASSTAAVFNSEFTRSKYGIVPAFGAPESPVIPLPVDFSLFTPQNAMACQQALSLPDGCVCWIGASRGAAGQVKGFDIFLSIVRTNPDIPFVGVFKDAPPESYPPNLRVYARLPHADLIKVIGACRVGLCTSRTESQHLAGIEMGACGLPMVAPNVGVYWNRGYPGQRVEDGKFTEALRATLTHHSAPELVSRYWREEFDIPVVRAQWEKLVEEVECSGQS